MARLSAFQAVVDVRSRFTGEGRRRLHVELAEAAIADADARNEAAVGEPLEHIVIVDGREGAALNSVREGGIIAAVWPFHLPVIDFAWATLAALSPYRTGRYQAGHIMLVDGVEHIPGDPVSPTAEVIFVNLLPYARRIEHGWSAQAPNGVYEAAMQIVRARFGNIADIRFRYTRIAAAGISADQSRRHGDDALPSIVIRPKRR